MNGAVNIVLALKRYMLSLPLKKSRHFATLPLFSREMTSEERRLLIGLKSTSTNQKRDQYGNTALVSQTSFRGETRGGVAKCGLFFQAVKQLHQSNNGNTQR